MPVTAEYVRQIFKGLEERDGSSFFDHVDDNVDWIVEGTHSLAGHYQSKIDFTGGTFAKLSQVLPKGAQLHVENILVSGDAAAVQLQSLAIAKNGFRFANRYCWIVYLRMM
jgi:ketosteroid isomerase-like protein